MPGIQQWAGLKLNSKHIPITLLLFKRFRDLFWNWLQIYANYYNFERKLCWAVWPPSYSLNVTLHNFCLVQRVKASHHWECPQESTMTHSVWFSFSNMPGLSWLFLLFGLLFVLVKSYSSFEIRVICHILKSVLSQSHRQTFGSTLYVP